MITKTFTATIGVGAGTAYIRPALLEEERRAGAQDWPHGPSAHCPLSSRETCRASCNIGYHMNIVQLISILNELRSRRGHAVSKTTNTYIFLFYFIFLMNTNTYIILKGGKQNHISPTKVVRYLSYKIVLRYSIIYVHCTTRAH